MSAGASLERLGSRWNTFWHAEASPLALGLFSIAFACCLYEEVATTRGKSVFAVSGGGFHLPYIGWIPLAPEWAYDAIHDFQYPFIVLLGVGLFPRFSCAVLLVLQGYVFFADQLNFRNHPYFFLLLLLLLMLSPAGEALSIQTAVRAWRRKESIAPALFGRQHPVTMQRLIQVQVCLVYFLAGLQKLQPSFLEGRVLHHILAEDLPTATPARSWHNSSPGRT